MKIHSLSSAITNSSTTVYCYAFESGANMIKDIINQVLKDGGSNKTFDVLYDIRITYDDDIYEIIADEHYEETKGLNWKEGVEWAKQYIKDNPDDIPEHWTGLSYPTHYEIIVKNNGDEELMNKINNLFDCEGFRDG